MLMRDRIVTLAHQHATVLGWEGTLPPAIDTAVRIAEEPWHLYALATVLHCELCRTFLWEVCEAKRRMHEGKDPGDD
jgi:hypothetical protein